MSRISALMSVNSPVWAFNVRYFGLVFWLAWVGALMSGSSPDLWAPLVIGAGLMSGSSANRIVKYT